MDLNFDLRAMHRLEVSTKELLWKTFNVRDLEDLSKSVVNGKNKDTVVEFAVKLCNLLKHSQALLKDASGDLDSLKVDQLQNKSQLSRVQDELSVKKSAELDAVKNTVEEKLSDWAAVVKNNSSGNKVTQKEVKKAVKSAMNENDREFNVIMFNVEEKDDENYDADTALNIIASAGATITESQGGCTVKRIGTLDKDKIRPLKVKFDSKSVAFDLLAKAKNLKDDERYGSVFVVPDRSKEERIERRKLVERLKLARTKNPGKKYYIWRKEICADDSPLTRGLSGVALVSQLLDEVKNSSKLK